MLTDRIDIEIPPPMENPPPWFAFWVDDFISSRKVELMNPKDVSAYLFLLIQCWRSSDCSLPMDDGILSKYSRLGSQWSKSKDRVLDCFFLRDGKLYNERLLRERWVALDRIEKAKKMANARWSRNRIRKEVENFKDAQAVHKQCTSNTQAIHKQCLGVCLDDAQAMPPHTSHIIENSINLKKVKWITIGKEEWVCPKCGGDVRLHRDANQNVENMMICCHCKEVFKTTKGLKKVE